jgi:hypothetical protein
LSKRKLVIVEWGDAWSAAAWAHQDDIDNTDCPVTSVGWLIKKDKNGVYLAGTIEGKDLEGPNLGNRKFVPAGMIKKIREVRW